MDMCIYSYIGGCVYSNTHTHTHTHIYIYNICIYIYIYNICMYIHTNIYVTCYAYITHVRLVKSKLSLDSGFAAIR